MASSTARAARSTRLSGMASGSSIVSVRPPRRLVLDFDGVGQRNGLEDGAQFVETVGAFVQHPQIEIDLRQRSEP